MRVEIIKLSNHRIFYRKQDNLWHYLTIHRITSGEDTRITKPTIERVNNKTVCVLINDYRQGQLHDKPIKIFTENNLIQVKLKCAVGFLYKDPTFNPKRYTNVRERGLKVVKSVKSIDNRESLSSKITRWLKTGFLTNNKSKKKVGY